MLNERSLFNKLAPNKSTGIINGEYSGVLNWDDVRFKWAFPLYKQILSNFWTPFQIPMRDDQTSWLTLSKDEQESFKLILGLLYGLDSIQTTYVDETTKYITDSSLQAIAINIAQQEANHNHSYSYVLSSIVPQQVQDEVANFWRTNEVILERNEFIFNLYQDFIDNPSPETFIRSLVADIILEGINFYASFAFFYDLARQGKMSRTNEMINYINRDENLHVRFYGNVLIETLRENPELNTPEFREWVGTTMDEAVCLEQKWGDYIIGDKFDSIDSVDLNEYVEFTANKRLMQMGFEKRYDAHNTLPWIKYFENPSEVKADFFEGHVRDYNKVSDDNGIGNFKLGGK